MEVFKNTVAAGDQSQMLCPSALRPSDELSREFYLLMKLMGVC